jgi:hypothetical protein
MIFCCFPPTTYVFLPMLLGGFIDVAFPSSFFFLSPLFLPFLDRLFVWVLGAPLHARVSN